MNHAGLTSFVLSFLLRMAPTSGYYAIYDEESKSIKLVDEQGFEEVSTRRMSLMTMDMAGR